MAVLPLFAALKNKKIQEKISRPQSSDNCSSVKTKISLTVEKAETLLMSSLIDNIILASDIQEVFHVYLKKIEIAASHSFLIIFSNNKFTLVNQISRNARSPRTYLFALFSGLKQSLTMSSQNLSV